MTYAGQVLDDGATIVITLAMIAAIAGLVAILFLGGRN